MFANYILSAYRSLIKQKLFSVINIIGLTIGFTVFTLIFLYVDYEYSFDKQWENSERIYVLTDYFKVNEQLGFKSAAIPFVALPFLKEYFPDQIEKSARLINRGDYVLVNESRFEGGIRLVESDFIEIFKLVELQGNLQNTLSNSNSLALSEELAQSYFGTSDVIGEVVSVKVSGLDLIDYQVTAVYKFPEGSASLNLPAIALFDEVALPDFADRFKDWTGQQLPMYFLMKEDADVSLMNAQLEAFVNQHVQEPWRVLGEGAQISDFHDYEFQLLSDTHFDSELQGSRAADKNKIVTFSVIGILVLLIASTNYVVLSTAKSEERRREVGVRKVLGASKSQLVLQYISESLFLCLLAFLLSLLMTSLFSTPFSALITEGLTLNIFNFHSVGIVLMVSVLVGILGGLYPALVLSSYDAVKTFKPMAKHSALKVINLRSVLVTFQFSIAIMLIVATLAVYQQLAFYKNRELGFNPQNVLSLMIDPNSNSNGDNIEPFVNSLKNLNGVEGVGQSTMPPNRNGMSMFSAGTYLREKNGEPGIDSSSIWVGFDFFDTYEIPFVAGRAFNRDFETGIRPQDSQENNDADEESTESPVIKLIINRTLSSSLGFSSPEEAIGEQLYLENNTPEGRGYNTYEIIGVVEDSHYLSLRENVEPESYTLSIEFVTSIAIRFQNSVKGTISEDVEAIWQNIIGEEPMRAVFPEQNIDMEFMQENNEGKMVLIFSLLAILVSCIGLYALASLTVKTNIKEIGVRKVLGANYLSILGLFLWRFLKPVIVATIIAAPISYWTIINWLQRFPDQISYYLLLPLFVAAAITTLVVASLTISASTTKAAIADPVRSLRYE